MKTCFKCNVAKPVTEFYRHPEMADGYLGKCKDCTKQDVMGNRLHHLDYYREYDRTRAALPHRRANADKQVALERERFPERGPMRQRSRRKLTAAAACELCLRPVQRIECHHFQYDRHDAVAWLCKPCHAIADRLRQLQEQRTAKEQAS